MTTHTVFDLVGKFRVVSRETPTATPIIRTKYIPLVKNMTPSQCAAGKSALESYMKVHNLVRPHIKTEGLERVWFEDWELKERKVA